MPYTLLRENIDKHIQFSDAEFKTYSSFFYPKTIPKKEYLLRQGDICRFEGFVTKGCFRVYTIDNDGICTKTYQFTDCSLFRNLP